jgi:glycosyltransferase involved in cell wall biosynthesis
MNPLKIVVINSWATDVVSGSGTAVFQGSFVRGLEGLGHTVEVIAPNFDVSDYVEATLKRLLFNAEIASDPRIKEADLIVGFDYDGYALLPDRRPPFLSSAHSIYGDIVRWESDPERTMVRAQAFFDKAAMSRADHVTIGSQFGKDRIVDLYGIAPDRISVIYHGMPRPRWMKALPPIRVLGDHPVILSVGRMYPRKRFGLLLHAVYHLREKYPTLEVRMIGEGLEWDALHNLAARLHIESHITWLGGVYEDAAFAREWVNADVFCHPSSQETFGFVYLEAMLLGKPIVAVQAGAAPEVLDDAALYAPPDDPIALAESLDRFLSDSTLREQYGQRALTRSLVFSHERMMAGYQHVIESLVNT